MPFSQTFPNGQILNSSALSSQTMTDIMQQATAFCLGLMTGKAFSATFVSGSNEVVVNSITGIQVYFKASTSSAFDVSLYGSDGYGESGFGTNIAALPDKTIITGIDQSTNTLTLSNQATLDGAGILFVSNPAAGKLVRQEWPSKGSPAWSKNDDICFLRAQEENGWYNKVRDQGVGDVTDTGALLTTEYTRIWEVSWMLYGPSAYDRATLIKSAMQLDFTHDSLAAFNVYLMPEIDNVHRSRESFEGEWWERSDFKITFYEQVTETIDTQSVTSVEVLVLNDNGIQLDLEIEA